MTILNKLFLSSSQPSSPFDNPAAAVVRHFQKEVQNSIDALLSSTWPYESVTPLQAYILGVTTSILIFVTGIYITRQVDINGTIRSERNKNIAHREKANALKNYNGGGRNIIHEEFHLRDMEQSNRYTTRPKDDDPPIQCSRRRYYNRVYRKEEPKTSNNGNRERALARRAMPTSTQIKRRATNKNVAAYYNNCSHKSVTNLEDKSTNSIYRAGCRSSNESFISTEVSLLQPPPKLTRSTQETSSWGFSSPSPPTMIFNEHSYKLYRNMNSQPLQNGRVQNEETQIIMKKMTHAFSDNISGENIKIPSLKDKSKMNPIQIASSSQSTLSAVSDGHNLACNKENSKSWRKNDKLGNKSNDAMRDQNQKHSLNLTTPLKAPLSTSNTQNTLSTSSCSRSSPKPDHSSTKNIVNILSHDEPADYQSENTPTISCSSQLPSKNITSSSTGTDMSFLSSSKGRLIALASIGVYDRKQEENQNKALQMLNDSKIPYELVDGMDTTQKERRNEFFRISGIRGNYPQFFLENDDGTKSFVGQWEELNCFLTSESDVLHKEFDVESNQVSPKDDISKGTSISTDDPHHKPEESPLPPHSDASNGKLTILISSGVFERVQKANQNAALQMINDMDIPHTLIDGMHLPQQDRRNELFQASGIRGNYPQFFLENDFLGQWDKVENLLVSGIIQARLGIGQQHASSGESNHQCESAVAALGSHCSPNKAHFTVLISKGVFDDLQADNQQAALDILDENNISFKVVDGMNPEHRCKREKLFRLSGIRGNYPQLFSSVRVDNHVYLGGYDWLKSCEIVNLRKILSSLEDTA